MIYLIIIVNRGFIIEESWSYFGGQSVEHEVSVITGMQVIENIDKSKYDSANLYQ